MAGLIILWLILDSSFGNIASYTGYPEGTMLGFFETASMMVAMQGLFILYWGSREPLKQYHVGLKFIAIKLVIFVSALQNFAIDLIVPTPNDGSFFDQEARIELYSNALLLIESAGLTLLMWKSFPADELIRAHVYRMSGKDVDDLEDPHTYDFPRSSSYGGPGLVNRGYNSLGHAAAIKMDNHVADGPQRKDSLAETWNSLPH